MYQAALGFPRRWRTFASANEHFRVDMPGQPHAKRGPIAVEGVERELVSYCAADRVFPERFPPMLGASYYCVETLEMDTGLSDEAWFDAVVEGVVGRGHDVIDERAVVRDARHPTLRLGGRSRSGGAHRWFEIRRVGKRAYVLARARFGWRAEEEPSRRFVDSFAPLDGASNVE
jgi:hypothetical protein